DHCGGFVLAVPHAAPEPVTVPSAIAAISRGVRDTLVITDPTTTFSPAGFERSGTDRSATHRGSAPTSSPPRDWWRQWPSRRCRRSSDGPGRLGDAPPRCR